MNKEEIIAMARQHTIGGLEFDQDGLVAFFKAAYAAGAAAEREACAKVCEQEWNDYCTESFGYALALKECAAAIRERSANAGARGQV